VQCGVEAPLTGTEGGATLTLFKNIVNMKTLIAVAGNARLFPQISMHLMMVEPNFKRI
jgi:hypothetical protein